MPIDKSQNFCDYVDGIFLKAVRKSIVSSFKLEKPPRHKVFCEGRTKHFNILNKALFIEITFYLEDDDRKTVDFNGDTMTNNLPRTKSKAKESFEILKTFSCCDGGRHYSTTLSFEGTLNKAGQKVLIGKWVHCKRRKSMTAEDETTQVEVSSRFFEVFGKNFAKVGQKLSI